MPFPSSYYLVPDSNSNTGKRVNLENALLPASLFGNALDPEIYNHRDGFSSAGVILAYFPDSISPNVNLKEKVHLYDFSSGEEVPVLAELDANANPKHEKQALVIQPLVRLRPKSRYIVMIAGVQNKNGIEVQPLSGFRKLRDQKVDRGSRLEKEVKKFEEIFQFLGSRGVRRGQIQLTWDFYTGSDESLTERLIKMRDDAFSYLEKTKADHWAKKFIHIQSIEKSPSKLSGIFRRYRGTFTVPSFLVNGHGNRLRLGADHEPVLDSFAEFPLVIHVPMCAIASKKSLPVMIYGHGTFNSAESEMADSYQRELINELCVIQVGTDWIGRSATDLSYFLLNVIPNWNNFLQITDRLQQAHLNFAFLARLIASGALNDLSDTSELAELPELKDDWNLKVDHSKLYYFGISEGGCQGVTALAISPDIQKGAMNVPCGFWSRFFWRSSDFYYTRRAMQLFYPGPMEMQKVMALSQLQWDYTDPANYGEHLLRKPLPGNLPKKILYQEGINDASVPNLTTRAMARTIGLKLLSPSVEPVENIPEASGPLDSAYVQFDVGVRPRLGDRNIPPEKSEVHEAIRKLKAVRDQLKGFLREGGQVEDSCGRVPCEFH